VDVTEIRQLSAYLKKLFDNASIRVVPGKKDDATIYVGDDEIGELTAAAGAFHPVRGPAAAAKIIKRRVRR